MRRLTKNGRHVLHRVLYDHHANRMLPIHHRTIVLAKVMFQAEPMEFTLDVTDDAWQTLPGVPEELIQRVQ